MEHNQLLNDEIEPVKAEKSLLDNRAKLKQQDLRDTHEDAKIGYIAIITGLILSSINTIVAILISLKFSASVAIPIICFGIFSILVFAFGYWAIYTYRNECQEAADSGDINRMEALDQSLPRTYVNFFLYMIILIGIFFFIISIGCFFFQTEALRYVDSVSKNQDKWKGIFGDKTYEYVRDNIRTYLNVAGLFSILLFLVCCFVIYSGFKLLGKYRMTQVAIQFICLVFFVLGCLFLYMGIYAGRYRDFAKVDKAMPAWVPDALLVIAILVILTAAIGFIASYLENSDYLKYYAMFTAALTVIIIILAFGAAAYSTRFQAYFDKKCNYVLDYMQEDYLIKYAKCEKKYLFSSNKLDGMDCPKNRVVSQWENNVGKNLEDQVESYGCLDSQCCYQAYSTIKNNIDYLALITFILFLLCAGLAVGSYYMYYRLTDTSVEREVAPKQDTKIYYYLAGFAGICAILTAAMVSTMPTAPEPSPTTMITVDKSFEATSPFIQIDLKADVNTVVKEEEKKNDEQAKKETSIAQDTSKCTDTNTCPKLKYNYDVVTNDGTFSLAENMQKINVINNKQETPQEWWLRMSGDESTLNYFLNSFTFNPKCLLKPSKIKMRVTAEAVPFDAVLLQMKSTTVVKAGQDQPTLTGTTQPATITTQPAEPATTESINATYNIDVSKVKVGDKFQVFDKVLDYSLISETEKTRITGKITQLTNLNTNVPIQAAQITLKSVEFNGCDPILVETTADGIFSTPEISLLNGGYELTFTFTVTSGNLIPYEKTITLGGAGYTPLLDLGQITLYSKDLGQTFSLSSVVINSIDNTFLPDATIMLYEGYLDVKNEMTDQSPAPTFIQLTQREEEEKKPIAKIQTDSNGKFIFDRVKPGAYTVVAEKDGFYREVRSIYNLYRY
jgi:hypothetical protein